MEKKNSHIEEVEKYFDLYHVDVFQFLITFTGNKSDAEDLTQETFMQLIKAERTLQNIENPKTWILSIAKHKAIDQYRKRKFLIFFQEKLLHQIPSPLPSPEELSGREETKAELLNKINALKANYRLVVILRSINELTVAETAAVLNWSESKVKTTYHRAIKQLKESLKNYSIERGIYHENA
ncbi:RNA polymerase sigma factor [Halobacillus salinarum]|uniref:RNA polymerase sigma factor n=1 Tax=Halobacillus salinarum TaxID=2932257 RepID=A0ABY4EM66_9BACI|nr:RNA polymerase sigma factor [Halobacillus salinarum]UOQ45480.1 RNA polymerase sigma factor [Halobacillus salinarum]